LAKDAKIIVVPAGMPLTLSGKKSKKGEQMVIYILVFILSLAVGPTLLLIGGGEVTKFLGIVLIVLGFLLFGVCAYNYAITINPDLRSLEIVTSGESVITIDCYGRSKISVNGIDLKNPSANDFNCQEKRTGDGAHTESVSFVEGKNYTIYKQNGFIFHNYIVVCDK
jgi:hypothetical protein